MFILLSVIFFDLDSLWESLRHINQPFSSLVAAAEPDLTFSVTQPCWAPSTPEGEGGVGCRYFEKEFIAVHSSLERKKAFSRLWLQEEKWHCLPWKLFLYFCVSKTLSQCLHFPNYHTMFALISATEDDYSIHVHMIHNNNLGLYSSKPTLHFTCFLRAQTLSVYLFHLSCVHECRQNIVLRLSCLGLWSDSLDRCTRDKSLVTWVWSSKPV